MEMPDENQNPVGVAQTPTNQSGDDFVLNFLGGENKVKSESFEPESHKLEGIEQENVEEMVSTNIDLNDIKIEDEKENDGVVDDNFNVSLDDNLSQENNENVSEQELSSDSNEIVADENNGNEGIENDTVEEDFESEEISNVNNSEEGEIDSDEFNVAEPENNLENEGNNSDELLLDNHENGDMNVDSDNELKDDEKFNFDDEAQESKLEYENKSIDESYDNGDMLEDDQDIEDNELKDNENLGDNMETKVDDETNISDDIEVEGDKNEIILSDEREDNKEEINEIEDDNKEPEIEDFGDDAQNENFNGNEDDQKVSDEENEFSYDFQEDPVDSEEKSVDANPVIDEENEEELVNQPETGDLLVGSSVDFSEESKDNIETQDGESNNESIDLQENISSTPENLDNNQSENNNTLLNNTNDEKQSFTLDYQEEVKDDSSNTTDTEMSKETVEGNKNNQVQEKLDATPENQLNEIDSSNLVNDVVSTSISVEKSEEKAQNLEQENSNSLQESTDGIIGQQIKSTLSLDQILDSELTNNPQFSDKSKAVPTNVSVSGSNKKMIGVIACVGFFVLAGVIAVLAFPSNNNIQNTGEGTGTQIVEEYGIDPTHQAPTQPEEEFTGQSTTAPHVVNPTIQQDFPEVETEDERDIGTEEQDPGEPAPYTCEGDECFEEPVITEEEDKKLDVSTIEPIISSFKSQAEGYYSKGDELQDKKLIRYASQAINLCESYQEQIKNGEGIDEESFASFNSKIKSIISKMENYLGGDNDVQTFTKSNFDEEYDFPGKEEHKEFIYEMANL